MEEENKLVEHVRAVLLDSNNNLILIHRVKPGKDYWVFPGGKPEGAESHLEALKREIMEEVGVEASIGDLIVSQPFFNQEGIEQKDSIYEAKIVSGEIGSGHGPEFEVDTEYEGSYDIQAVPLEKVKDLPLRPENVKDLVLNRYQKTGWAKHYEDTKNYPPSELLVMALGFMKKKNKAIDIGGGGPLRDSRYLLSLGFDTTVLDQEEIVASEVEKVGSEKLHCHISKFSDFDFPEGEYDIASAMYSLPFSLPEVFDEVLEKIKNSLVKGGIFCAQFFGLNDDWNGSPHISFHSKDQVLKLLEGMEILFFEEKEFDGNLADGSPKHRHVFDVIARKI